MGRISINQCSTDYPGEEFQPAGVGILVVHGSINAYGGGSGNTTDTAKRVDAACERQREKKAGFRDPVLGDFCRAAVVPAGTGCEAGIC